MTFEEANGLINQRIKSDLALSLLNTIDSKKFEVFGVEGFINKGIDIFESKLDLIFDVSNIMNISSAEKLLFVREFVRNRVADNTFFEVYGEAI